MVMAKAWAAAHAYKFSRPPRFAVSGPAMRGIGGPNATVHVYDPEDRLNQPMRMELEIIRASGAVVVREKWIPQTERRS
jgi:hypothetical protein